MYRSMNVCGRERKAIALPQSGHRYGLTKVISLMKGTRAALPPRFDAGPLLSGATTVGANAGFH